MGVTVTYKDLPKEEHMYKYYLLSAMIPRHLVAVHEKYHNICSIYAEYANFLTKPSKKEAKYLLKASSAGYLLSDNSIVYRKGVPEEDFYFWLGYHHKFTYGWDDKNNQIAPFSFIYFDFIGHFWNKKEGIKAILKTLNQHTYSFFDDYLKKQDDYLVVDLNQPGNAYILGYVMKNCPKKLKKVKIIPKNQEKTQKIDEKTKKSDEKAQDLKNDAKKSLFFVKWAKNIVKWVRNVKKWLKTLFTREKHDKLPSTIANYLFSTIKPKEMVNFLHQKELL